MDLIIVAIFAAIALLGLAASQWGVDSRPTFVDPRLAGQGTGIF
jgi:hypothetical protein